MTDHSDLIERLHLIAMGSLKPDNGSSIPLADELRRAASALSSQSLSLSEAREEIERLKGLVAGIRECPQEPPGVLCYVAHGRAWFTTASLAEQWGDDWNDEPYEHNAGSPYPEPGVTLTAVAFDAGDLVTPEHEQINSRWSVENINAGGTPWLRSSPYGCGTVSVMAGVTFREFQQALLASGGTALMPWPVKEEDALRAEISRLEALAPMSARETARYLEIERRLSALENCKPALADANTNPASSDLSSLRKGAEVAPLEWHRVTYGWLAFEEWYRIEDQGSNWPTERYWLYERDERLGKFDTFEQADATMFARHEKRIRSALSPAATPVSEGDMRAFGASEMAAYKWPDDTPEHRAARAAFCEGAALAKPDSSPAGEREASLSRSDVCRLWQYAVIERPSMTVEGFTNLLLNEIDDRAEALSQPTSDGRVGE